MFCIARLHTAQPHCGIKPGCSLTMSKLWLLTQSPRLSSFKVMLCKLFIPVLWPAFLLTSSYCAYASNMAKKYIYAYEAKGRLCNLPIHQDGFPRYIDSAVRPNILRPISWHLETLYDSLRLNVAYTKYCPYCIWRTTNPYYANCCSLETVEHIILECPAYRDHREFFEWQMEKTCHDSSTLCSVLGTMPGPSKQRRVLYLLFKYLSEGGLVGKL